MMSNQEKQYGLLDPKTAKKITASDVFGNDSDSDPDSGCDWLKKSNQKEEKVLKKQTKIEMQRALQQDPTVYQYDEIYDEMMQKKEEVETSKVTVDSRKPKYIQALMKSADKRKKENERRLERQIQKEREAEGDMFQDKEEFITSSYKQKLEEFKKAEEEERKMEYIESIMDVSKQQDLGGFYRNFYKETVAKEKEDEKIDEGVGNSLKETENNKSDRKSATDDPKPERNYRKRSNSGSNDQDEKKSKQDSSSSSSDSDSSSDSSSTTSSSDDEGKNDNKENESKPKPSNNTGGEENDSVKNADKEKKEDRPSDMLREDSKNDKKNDARRWDSKNEKPVSRSSSKPSAKLDDRRDRSYRSYNDRDHSSRSRNRDRSSRDDRSSYRDRDRDRDRSRRNDRRVRDRRERRRSDSRKRRRSRSRSSDGRKGREKSRERRSERSRSRRRSQRDRDGDAAEEVKKKAVKNPGEDDPKGSEVKKEDEPVKASIWEKRTVGAVLEAALERYYQRKAARAS